MLCQRGIDAPAWHWLDAHGQYRKLDRQSATLPQRGAARCGALGDGLRHWRQSFHIDGFRFDLASDSASPNFTPAHIFFRRAHQDPLLAGCKSIAEPWDIGQGGHQLGAFPTPSSSGTTASAMISAFFWLRQSGRLGVFAERWVGSADVFRHQPDGINFLTAHDGFTPA